MDHTTDTIAGLGERAIIERFVAPLLSENLGNVLLDDCAMIDVGAPTRLLLSTDQGPGPTFLELLGVGTPADVGHFHVTINASDLAAMGGHPIGILMVLALSGDETESYLFDFLRGVREAMTEYDLLLLGGDTKQAKRRSTTITIIGKVHEAGPLLRRGAQRGDRIFLTPGLIGEALQSYILAARANGHREVLRPHAQLAFGQRLAREKISTSCMDMSDGVIATAMQLAQLNGVAFNLDAEAIPYASSPSHGSEHRWRDLVLNVGGDFGLMFTTRAADANVAQKLGALPIGEVTYHQEDWLNRSQLEKFGIGIRGWEQFKTTEPIIHDIRSFV